MISILDRFWNPKFESDDITVPDDFLISSNWQIQATLIGLKWAELPKTTYLLSRSYNRIPTGMLVPSKRMSELNEIV